MSSINFYKSKKENKNHFKHNNINLFYEKEDTANNFWAHRRKSKSWTLVDTKNPRDIMRNLAHTRDYGSESEKMSGSKARKK